MKKVKLNWEGEIVKYVERGLIIKLFLLSATCFSVIYYFFGGEASIDLIQIDKLALFLENYREGILNEIEYKPLYDVTLVLLVGAQIIFAVLVWAILTVIHGIYIPSGLCMVFTFILLIIDLSIFIYHYFFPDYS